MTVVADSGPLIALAKVGALDLLTKLYRQVLTPPTVHVEVVAAGLAQNAPDAADLDAAYSRGLLQIHAPTPGTLSVPAPLHSGEEESIRLAIELQADWLLVDDLDARQAAEVNFAAAGVSTEIKGTLGVIVTAFQQNLLTRQAAIDLVDTLRRHPDIWIASALCDQIIDTLRRAP